MNGPAHPKLRAFGFGELLDGAFALYRHDFVALFLAALLPQLPVVVYWLVMAAMMTGADTDLATQQAASLLIVPYNLFQSVLIMCALTHGVWRAYLNEPASFGEMLKVGLRHWIAAAIASALCFVAIFAGLLFFVIPALFIAPLFFAVAPAIVVEERGALAAIVRSSQLSRGARLRILGVLAVTFIILALPVAAVYSLAGVWFGRSLLGGDPAAITQSPWLFALSAAGGSAINALTTPFLTAVVVLLYVDRRHRTEAYDLEAAAARLANQN